MIAALFNGFCNFFLFGSLYNDLIIPDNAMEVFSEHDRNISSIDQRESDHNLMIDNTNLFGLNKIRKVPINFKTKHHY